MWMDEGFHRWRSRGRCMPELEQIGGRFAESTCFVVLVWFCCEGAVNVVL
jgi:hypothetical protein